MRSQALRQTGNALSHTTHAVAYIRPNARRAASSGKATPPAPPPAKSKTTTTTKAQARAARPPPSPPSTKAPVAGASASSSKPGGKGDKAKNPAWQKYKAGVYTACFAAVTFTGTIYGAGLKTQKEFKEVGSQSTSTKHGHDYQGK